MDLFVYLLMFMCGYIIIHALVGVITTIASISKFAEEKRLSKAKAQEVELKNNRDALHRKSVENQIKMEELYISIAEERLKALREGGSEKNANSSKEEDALLRELERKIGQKPRD